jgi:hypothetical protein
MSFGNTAVFGGGRKGERADQAGRVTGSGYIWDAESRLDARRALVSIRPQSCFACCGDDDTSSKLGSFRKTHMARVALKLMVHQSQHEEASQRSDSPVP